MLRTFANDSTFLACLLVYALVMAAMLIVLLPVVLLGRVSERLWLARGGRELRSVHEIDRRNP